MARFSKVLVWGLALVSFNSFAFLSNAVVPDCMDGNQEIYINNDHTLDLKRTTKNGAERRAYVSGRIEKMPWVRGSHTRFIIRIGNGQKDIIEVVYNNKFGPMPQINPTSVIKVCGDFINAYAKHNGYDASPAGAIIHWVHFNPGTREMKHEHGFVMIDDKLVGFDEASEEAWQGQIVYNPLRAERGQGNSRSYEESNSTANRSWNHFLGAPAW